MYLLARKTVIKLIDQLTFVKPGARGQIEATHQMFKYLEMISYALGPVHVPFQRLEAHTVAITLVICRLKKLCSLPGQS